MTEKTEVLVRDTLQRQTDRAPDALGLLLRFEQQPRKSSRRTLGLVGVAAAVALVLVGGSMLLVRPGGADEPGQNQAAAGGGHVPVPVSRVLPWKPHWVPAGMTEKTRMLARNATVRMWTDTPVDQTGNTKGPTIALTENFDARPFAQNGGDLSTEKVSINGVPGTVMVLAHNDVMVSWQPPHEDLLSVRVMRLDDAKNVALRVARSVRKDDRSSFASLISAVNLPKNWGPTSVVRVYGNSPQTAQTEITMSRVIPGDNNGGMVLYAFTLLPGRPLPNPVDGYSERPVRIEPAPGVPVVLEPDLMPAHNPDIDNKADVARIGKLVKVNPYADVSWIGTP